MRVRRRGALGGSMQGRRERPYWTSTGATEDAAAGCPARRDDSTVHFETSPRTLGRHPASCAAFGFALEPNSRFRGIRGRHMRSGRHALAGAIFALVVALVASPLAGGT